MRAAKIQDRLAQLHTAFPQRRPFLQEPTQRRDAAAGAHHDKRRSRRRQGKARAPRPHGYRNAVAGREPQVVLLTSATPSEGKTTASLNLAAVLAQRDVRVLLIDADLRRPTVHHRFGLNGKIGLTSVLTGSVELKDAVQNVSDLPSLDVLASGPIPPFPTEMLSSDAMRRLLQEARHTYTHVVMDSPPLLSVTDSVVLAREADTVVLIVRHGKSTKHAVRRARDLLLRSGARVAGIALNAVDLSSPEYYSYYGYSGYAGYASAGVDSNAWESQGAGPGTTPREGNVPRSGGPTS